MELIDFLKSKDQKYLNWIEANFPTAESAYLKCAEATLAMKEVFPELMRVRGFALVEEPFGLPPTKAPHWWLLDNDGFVVDPTGHQWPTRVVDYEPADESKGEPTGKCPNCGNLCYNNDYLCSKKCDKEYMAYLNDY